MALDWGIGRYEETAKQLEPVATLVVRQAAIKSGQRALDLGCGTGNAALELAGCGAKVIAVDPSPRLVEVTRQRATAAGVPVDVRQGEAAAIPVDDDSIDVIISVFAVIFAPDPSAAIADIKRVLAPGGRVLLTAWIPGSGIGSAYAGLGPAVARATGVAPPPTPFGWHDTAALSALAAPHGLTVKLEEASIALTAESPEAHLERDATTQPRWVDALAQLREAGVGEEVIRTPALAALRGANEDPAGFRVTSRYVIATLS